MISLYWLKYISIFTGYSMPKLFLEKNSCGNEHKKFCFFIYFISK